MFLDRLSYRTAGVLLVLTGLAAGCAGSSPGPPPSYEPLPGEAREVNVAAKLRQRAITFVEELLIGEPSVRVNGRTVRIRGSRSGPMWVIDGIYTSTPFGISPYDVDRMWINASGQGYGRRGANGVIILITKKGGS